MDTQKYGRHLLYDSVIRDLDAIEGLNKRFCDFRVKYDRWTKKDNGEVARNPLKPIGSTNAGKVIVGVGIGSLCKNRLSDNSVLDYDAAHTSFSACHEMRHLWLMSVGNMRSSDTTADWAKDIARNMVLTMCFDSYMDFVYWLNPAEISSDHAAIQGMRALYDARKRTDPEYADVDLNAIFVDMASRRYGPVWSQFKDCRTIGDVENAYAEILSLAADRYRFSPRPLYEASRGDSKMRKLLENTDFVNQLTSMKSGREQTDMLCRYVGEHYPEYFRMAPCIADEYFFPNEKNEKELKYRESHHIRPLYDHVALVPPTYKTEDFIEPEDMVLFEESLKTAPPYRPVLVIPQLASPVKSVKSEPSLLARSPVVPDIDRYVTEHGNGVTDAGITRSLRLLPALRAIGDPAGGLHLTQQDISDVHVFLNGHKDHGELRFSDYGHTLRIDVKAATDAGREALDRLSAQCLPDGTTKALAAGQAVVLAMTPSEDMAHKSFWDLLGSMAGTQDMAGFTNSDVAAATVQTILTMPSGRHAREEADKLSDNWKDLMRRAPSTVMSGNPSLYMMQFVMLQNIAALDGYDLSPDEQQGRQIGGLLRKKPLDTDALRDALSDCVTSQAEAAATEIGLDKTVKPDESTPVNPILRTLGKPLDRKSGPDGPDF